MELINSIKEILKQKKAIIKATIMVITGLIGSYSWLFPLSINEEILNLEKNYLTVSIICGTLFLLFFIIISIKNGRRNKINYYDIAYISPIIALEIICVLMCFNSQLWGLKKYIIGVAVVWLLFIEFLVAVKALFGKFLGQERIPIILMAFAFLSLLFAFTNERIGENEPAKLFYQVSYGVAYLLAFAVYTNKYIYRLKKNRGISNILGIVFWGGLIAISFPFYVQWCGLKRPDFDSFVTVYSAVLGGGITLAGVAWTINDGNTKRQEDLQRIEDERKQDERRLYRPFLNFYAGHYKGTKTDIWVYEWIGTTDKFAKVETEKLTTPNYINDCYFVNTDFSNFYVWGLKIENQTINFDSIRFIRKNAAFYLQFSKQPFYTERPIESLSLILEDMLENLYELPLVYEVDTTSNTFRIVGNNLTVLLDNIIEHQEYK